MRVCMFGTCQAGYDRNQVLRSTGSRVYRHRTFAGAVLGRIELSFSVRRAGCPLLELVDHDVAPGTHGVVQDANARGAPAVPGDVPSVPGEHLAVVPRRRSDDLVIDEKFNPEPGQITATCNAQNQKLALENKRGGAELPDSRIALAWMITRNEPADLANRSLLPAKRSSSRPAREGFSACRL